MAHNIDMMTIYANLKDVSRFKLQTATLTLAHRIHETEKIDSWRVTVQSSAVAYHVDVSLELHQVDGFLGDAYDVLESIKRHGL